MKRASLPKNETERLRELHEYDILDTLPEQVFDDLTALVAQICGTTMASISLVDKDRQWFKSRVGDLVATETPRDIAFCAHTILQDKVLIVKDSAQDERFHDNPLALAKVKFYAGAPLITPNGHNIGALCAIDSIPRDLSPEATLALEALARQVISQMELRISIRKMQQVTAELEKAKEMSEQANLAKSEFLANISHEIRTPMNGIIGMGELLLESKLDEDQRGHLQTLNQAADNLLSLINDLLDISKIEAGQITFEKIDFSPEEILGKTCEVLAPRAHAKGLELLIMVDKKIPKKVIGDSNRLRQILLNLIGNAIKFTHRGEVAVELLRDSTHSGLQFKVRDTGIGMSENQRLNLFQRFFQADSSITRKYGGTGLGLSICKQLVEGMQGTLNVETQPGVGSTFSFTLPFDYKEGADHPTRFVDIRGYRCLVIDDNETNRLIARRALESWGAICDEAESGKAGLKALREAAISDDPYGLLLLDCRMPEMSGLEVAAKINELALMNAPIVMMLTSDDRAAEMNKTRQLGISEYLVKPLKRAELESAVRLIIGDHQKTRANEPKLSAPAESPEFDGQLKVLIVDDNQVNRTILESFFRGRTKSLRSASNGAEACEIFSAEYFDLVLLDIQMPVMDGYTAIRKMREIEKTTGRGHTSIIAFTAHTLEAEREKCEQSGFDAHLSKPVKKAQLFALLSEFEAKRKFAA